MSHEFESGFSVREPMWHGLGLVVDEYPGREEAMRLAGHNFTVLERSLFMIDGLRPTRIPDWKGLVRSDTGDFLGAAKDSYEVVQNVELWDMAEALLQEKSLKYETAGVLRGGRVIWVLVRLNEPIVIPNDSSPIYAYLRISTTHDGSGALKAIASNVRTVCWNTFSMGESESSHSGLQYTFRHTKKVREKIEAARAQLGLARTSLSRFQELAFQLSNVEVSEEQIITFVHTFIPKPVAEGALTDRILSNIEANRMKVFSILRESRTIDEAHRHTAWGLFNAGIEFLDHMRAFRSSDTYFERAFSDNGAFKSKLASLALNAGSV